MIELRLRNVAQLFNTLDPFPFRERDLATEAEEYIVQRAQELPLHEAIAISIEIGSESDEANEADICSAVHLCFASKAENEARRMKLLFKDGRIALLIGICVIVVCLLSAWRISSSYPDAALGRIVGESLVIIGWVCLWRPVDLLVYDWVPMVRRKKLYRRLSSASITVAYAS